MKKIIFLLIALICSVSSINAEDIYLRGNFNGWGTSDKFTTTDDDTYTLNLSSLYGEFKIADANWSTINYGGDDPVELNKEYQCTYDGKNLTLADGQVSNVTVTFVLSTKKLTISGEKAANTYDKLYLIGDFNGVSWNESRTDCPLEPVEGAAVPTFKGTYDMTAGWFKVLAGTWQYGPGELAASDLSVAVGFDDDIYYPAGSHSFAIAAGTYTFTVTMPEGEKTAHMTIEGESTPIVVVSPESLYILGECNGNSWDPAVGCALTKGDNGVFTGTDLSFNDDRGYSYFSFAETLTGDWSTLVRYGAAEDGKNISTGESAAFISGENAFVLDNGVYDITVDFSTMTVTAKLKSLVSIPETLYILGDFNYDGDPVHWDDGLGIQMSGNDGVFTAKDVELIYGADMAPAAYFSFCTQLDGTGSWNVGSRYGATATDTSIAAGDTLPLVVAGDPYAFAAAPGMYNIVVDLNNMTVTLSEGSGVATIANTNDALVNVYNVQGVQIRKAMKAGEATQNLPAGLYIVGGKKVIVK
jgi:hypothetical protein